MWSDLWPAMDGVVCLSIVLEGGVTVSNNFSKRRQNGFIIGTRDKFAPHLFFLMSAWARNSESQRMDACSLILQLLYISNEIVIYTIFIFYDQ